jgi:hypothetical protein
MLLFIYSTFLRFLSFLWMVWNHNPRLDDLWASYLTSFFLHRYDGLLPCLIRRKGNKIQFVWLMVDRRRDETDNGSLAGVGVPSSWVLVFCVVQENERAYWWPQCVPHLGAGPIKSWLEGSGGVSHPDLRDKVGCISYMRQRRQHI